MDNKNGKKEDQPYIWDFDTQYPQVFWYFIGFAICYFTGMIYSIFLSGEIPFIFVIAELDDLPGSSSMSIRDLIDLIMMGPTFGVIAWWIRTKTIGELQKNKLLYDKKWDYAYIFCIGIMVMGNTAHVIANRFSAAAVEVGGSLQGVYFYDEFFGHFVLVMPLFLMSYINFKEQVRVPVSYKMDTSKWTAVILGSIGFGIGVSLAMLEGQNNLPIMIVQLIFLPKVLIELKKNWKEILTQPVIIFFLLELIAYIIMTIIHCSINGLKPNYPFMYQPSELR
ncbi:MAG: hypothetical protein GY870_11925 [archaeon]|nr:hypothetical protein [archaeon]